MKNILAAVSVVMALLATNLASADQATESNSDAQSNATINATDNSQSIVNNPPQYITPTKLDGSFVAPPQLYYDPRLSDSIPQDAIPPIYQLEGWKIFYSAPYNNNDGVKLERIKSERKRWISNQESTTGEKVDSNARATKNGDTLVILPYYPDGAKEVAIAKVFLTKETYIINQAFSEAWYHAWEKSKAKYYIILYNTRLVSEANVNALGSAMVGGITIGPERNSSPVVGAGGGMGFGTAKAHVFKEPAFMVIAFSNAGEIPPRLLKKDEVLKEEPVAQEVTEEPVKQEETKKPEPEVIFPVVEFDRSKFKLVTERQKKPIRAAAKKAAENWDKMQKDNMYILIVGSCSPEGTVDYNDVLGRKRAQEVYNLFTTILVDVYGIPAEEVKERVKFVSAGENNPEFNDITKQRNAAFFIAAKINTPQKE